MMNVTRRTGRSGVALAALGVLVLAGCESLLEVDDTGFILPESLEEAGPSAVPAFVNGMVGAYQEAFDDIVLYTSLITDEMIAAGTFSTRLQVDNRRIQPNNGTLTGEIYTPLHHARQQADTTVLMLQGKLQDPRFAESSDELRKGIALGGLFGGYTRLWLGEMYCWSILTGMFPESRPILPNARVQQAVSFLQDAETRAAAAGLADIRLAAIVGQARAQLWLRNYSAAANLAARVPRDFVFWMEYSHNTPGQYNEVYMVTHGDQSLIDWTVGTGELRIRGNERWEHLDGFLQLNLLEDRPEGFEANVSTIPVVLQTLYNRPDSDIMMASGVEAMLIRAEAAVRAGQTAVAAGLLNDLRADYSRRINLQQRVDLPDDEDQLQPLTLTGNLAADVETVLAERARERGPPGDRHTTSRRLRLEPSLSLNLFPSVKFAVGGGDDISFPIVQQELDNNPNLSTADACPPGQEIGFWR